MKAKRSFPLTSIETVDYDESSDPKRFCLTFSNSIEILQAQTIEDASDWVEKIVQGEFIHFPANRYVPTVENLTFSCLQHVPSGILQSLKIHLGINYQGQKQWKNVSPWEYNLQSTQLQGYVAMIEKEGPGND